MGHSPPLFLFVFSIQKTVKCSIYFLPMTRFEPWTSWIGSDRSTNWATTIALLFTFPLITSSNTPQRLFICLGLTWMFNYITANLINSIWLVFCVVKGYCCTYMKLARMIINGLTLIVLLVYASYGKPFVSQFLSWDWS